MADVEIGNPGNPGDSTHVCRRQSVAGIDGKSLSNRKFGGQSKVA
jgi:hypothetical protein